MKHVFTAGCQRINKPNTNASTNIFSASFEKGNGKVLHEQQSLKGCLGLDWINIPFNDIKCSGIVCFLLFPSQDITTILS